MKASDLLKLSLLLTLLQIYSCGIKANPKPLENPIVEVKRVGANVFLRSLEGEVVPEGFVKINNYWVKEQAQPFCFLVQRVEGKKIKKCVKGLTEEKVGLDVEYQQDKVKLNLKGFDVYEIYPIEGEILNPWRGKKVLEKLEIERDYIRRCYLIVGEKREGYSEPAELCIEPLPHPPIKEVERLEYRVSGDRLYLIWSYEPDHFFKEFVIYENDREVGTTSSYVFDIKRKDKETKYTVKVRSIYGKESKGVSIFYSP